MRVLALDGGSPRWGCAVSDPTGVLATPLDPVTVPNSRRGIGRLRALVAELEVAQVPNGKFSAAADSSASLLNPRLSNLPAFYRMVYPMRNCRSTTRQ